MSEKKFYWLKLQEDFFRNKAIKKLRRIAGGDTYTVIYLKMLLLSLKDDGKLYFEGIEESFESELALELDEQVDDVQVTIMFLRANGLLEVSSGNDEFYLTETSVLTGSETAAAARVRRHRQLKNGEAKALHCNAAVTQGNGEVTACNNDETSGNNMVTPGNVAVTDGNGPVTNRNTEIEIELKLEKELELEKDSSCAEPLPKTTDNSPPQRPNATVRLTNFKIPLVHNDQTTGKKEEHIVTVEDFSEWSQAYPGVNVAMALNDMRQWCLSNPEKCKTRKGVRAFIVKWLGRAQDKGQYPRAGANARAAPESFELQEERRALFIRAKGVLANDGKEKFEKYCRENNLNPQEVQQWITQTRPGC